jgi:predicted GIY-YIG superfamily endonuclease
MKTPIQYSVYILPKENYCGVTTNIDRRINEHKNKGKDISSVKVVLETNCKETALAYEKHHHLELGMNGYIYTDKWRVIQREKCDTIVPSNKRKKKIICIETGAIYDSLRECSREFGSSHGNLSKHLKGHIAHTTFCKHTFKYYEES